MVVVAVRVLAVAAFVLGLYACFSWAALPRLPEAALQPANTALRVQLFPMLAFQVTVMLRGGEIALGYAVYALTAATLFFAATLAMWLAWRGPQRATVRHLTVALSLAALSVSWFWFLREFEPTRAVLTTAQVVLDPLAMAAGLFALIATVACFRIYPEPYSREIVRRDNLARSDARGAQARRIRDGEGWWRLWAWLPDERYADYGRCQLPQFVGVRRLLGSRELLWLLLIVAIAVCGTLWSPWISYTPIWFRGLAWLLMACMLLVVADPVFGARCDEGFVFRFIAQYEHTMFFGFETALHRFFGSIGGWIVVAATAVVLNHLWHRGATTMPLSALLLFSFITAATGHSLSLLFLNWRHGLPEQRRAIGWIFLGTAGTFALWVGAFVIVGTVQLIRWSVTGESGLSQSTLRAIGVVGPPFIALTFVLSLWASILHRGSFDPGLALRRGAGYAVLGVVLTACFVAIEGAVSSLVVVHLGMPSQSGPVLAGTAVALGFGPLRERVDRGVQRVMQRLLPPEAVAAGERRECAIVFSDLSGYTRLAEIDEEEAVTLAAILHRNARVVADAHGGRVVKTIGDAVLCVYPDAASALAASVALHAGYRAECAKRDSEALPVHSGLHVGELVIAPDGDVFGASVNLAARLQTLAGANELIASNTAAAAIAASALASESLPARRFKNIAEPVDCLRVRLV